MSKVYDTLQSQLKTKYKKEAEDCIKIYNKLLEISKEVYGKSHVWQSDWTTLVTTKLVGTFPNVRKIHVPTAIGKVFLKGINHENSIQ